MKISRRNLFFGVAALTASSRVLASVALLESVIPAAHETKILSTAGRSFSFFRGSEDYFSINRWDTNYHTKILPKQFQSIVFSENGEGANIYYHLTDNLKSPIYTMHMPGLTEEKFAQALAAQGDLVDLTPQGMRAIGVDILTEEEWQTLAKLQLRSRVLGIKPKQPASFIQSTFEEIEANPNLLMRPEDHPVLVEEIRRDYAEVCARNAAFEEEWKRLKISRKPDASAETIEAEGQVASVEECSFGQRLLTTASSQMGEGVDNLNPSLNETHMPLIEEIPPRKLSSSGPKQMPITFTT
jgi:hypothetical protein